MQLSTKPVITVITKSVMKYCYFMTLCTGMIMQDLILHGHAAESIFVQYFQGLDKTIIL